MSGKGLEAQVDIRPEESCPISDANCPLFDQIRELQRECERLREMTRTDGLTGLYNHRCFMQSLEQEMERTRRTGMPTSLIMIDLDDFKRVNDRFGHQAGDEVLRAASRVWRDSLRKIDIPCRYGGEEFAIILPGTRWPYAVRVAERLREALATTTVQVDGGKITVTASFGVDDYFPSDRVTPSEFIKQVDRYLLQAKKQGRNRVCNQSKDREPLDSEVTSDERAALFVGRWP